MTNAIVSGTGFGLGLKNKGDMDVLVVYRPFQY